MQRKSNKAKAYLKNGICNILTRGKLDLSECFIDATFAGVKKRVYIGPTKRGKETKVMAIADYHGLPIALYIESASCHETKLVEEPLDKRFLRKRPRRLVGDKAYDDDGLDKRLRELKIKLIAPH